MLDVTEQMKGIVAREVPSAFDVDNQGTILESALGKVDEKAPNMQDASVITCMNLLQTLCSLLLCGLA